MKRHFFFFFFSLMYFAASTGWTFDGIESSTAEDLLTSPSAAQANLEGEPSAVVHGCVNILTGDFFEAQVDLVLPGSDPFRYERFYCSSDHQIGLLFHGWNHNLGGSLTETLSSRHHYGVTKGYAGGQMVYKDKRMKSCLGIDPEILQKGVVNTSSGTISARTNIKNNELIVYEQIAKLYTGSGAKHVYYLYQEKDSIDNFNYFVHRYTEKPNGNRLEYRYNCGSVVSAAGLVDREGQLVHKVAFNYPTRSEFKKHLKKDTSFVVAVNAPDGRKIEYKYKFFRGRKGHDTTLYRMAIIEAERPQGPKEVYTYEDKCSAYLERVIRKDRPDGRSLQIEYHKTKGFEEGKVKCLKAPAGKDATPVPIYTFDYQTQGNYKKRRGMAQTVVWDALDHQTIYEYFMDDYRLRSVKRYKGTDPYTLYSEEKMFWGAPDTPNDSHLISRTLQDEKGQIAFCRHYVYDELGNILEDQLYGNLSGKSSQPVVMKNKAPLDNGAEKHTKSYTYSNDLFNLVTSAKEPGIETQFRYHPGTDLLQAKYVIFNGSIQMREFYEYDARAAVTFYCRDNGCKEKVDDLTGVTERQVNKIENNKFGLPLCMEEFYLQGNKLVLLKKSVNHYDPLLQLIQQDHYDANGAFAYSLFWEYDPQGHVIKETNALGHVIYRTYDANGNLLSEQGPRPDQLTRFTYDRMNRKISEEVILPSGKSLKTNHTYDLQGKEIAITDIYGNVTQFEYDDFGRAIKTIQPEVKDKNGNWARPNVHNQYDVLGNLIAVIDACGNKTRMAYTATGKIYLKQYPDGSEERFEYTLKGELAKTIARDGSYTCYTYDAVSRPTKTEVFSPSGVFLSVSKNEYNAFHLISETDPAGYVTRYAYDGAGRLIRTEKEGQLTTYAYDSLGRQSEIHDYFGMGKSDYINNTITYDALNRVVMETEQDANGGLISRIDYAYDANGNCTEATTYHKAGVNVQATEYNVFGQPVYIENALGNSTHITYCYDHLNGKGQRVPYCEIKDPMGTITVTIQDALGRVVFEGKKNAAGQEIQAFHSSYDANGNKVQQQLVVQAPNTPVRSIFNTWSYDCLNRLIAAIEAVGTPEQKKSFQQYNKAGQLEKIIKPDGTVISHRYDYLGRLTDFSSSDGSVHYTYAYDKNHQPICIDDLVQSTKTLRKYDRNNLLIYEKLANGWVFEFQLDRMGRLTDMRYPDRSSIHYDYAASQLKNIEIKNHESQKVLAHQYTEYDLADNLISAVVNGDFKIDSTYDLLGRPIQIKSNAWEESIQEYDKVGHLLHRKIVDPFGQVTCKYTYDDLYQLKSETGIAPHDYVHDSVYNQVKKDGQNHQVNSLNQLLKDGQASYTYDANGNRRSALNENGKTLYGYDALNRLITVEKNGDQWRYRYDPFNRRISKEHWTKDANGSWNLQNKDSYIYVKQNEVGMITQNNVLAEKRFLGLGKGGEIGAAVFIREWGRDYIPIHDHKGNVCQLLNASSKQSIEGYRYGAFGQEHIYTPEGNKDTACQPWRFTSKRYDPETGFLYFGERYYDPATSRWASPDPIGFEGGPNLYAYVYNNPLKWLDIRGLNAEFGLDYFHTGIDEDMSVYKESRGLMEFSSGFANGFAHGVFDWYGTMHHDAYAIDSVRSMAWNRDFSPLQTACNNLGDEGCANWLGQTMGKNIGTGIGMTYLAALSLENWAFQRCCYAVNGVRNFFGRQALKNTSEAAFSVASKEAIPLTESFVAAELQFVPTILKGNKDFGLIHIMRRHGYNSTCKNVSRFKEGFDENIISDLIKQGVKKAKSWEIAPNNPNRATVFDVGENIGLNLGGVPTSHLRIVVDPQGTVVTAYPF